MSGDDERRQRAVMATDAEWERIVRAAAASGMDRSRFVVHRALMPDVLPAGVLRRAVREILVLSLLVLSLLVSLLEEKRLREAGILCQLAWRTPAWSLSRPRRPVVFKLAPRSRRRRSSPAGSACGSL